MRSVFWQYPDTQLRNGHWQTDAGRFEEKAAPRISSRPIHFDFDLFLVSDLKDKLVFKKYELPDKSFCKGEMIISDSISNTREVCPLAPHRVIVLWRLKHCTAQNCRWQIFTRSPPYLLGSWEYFRAITWPRISIEFAVWLSTISNFDPSTNHIHPHLKWLHVSSRPVRSTKNEFIVHRSIHSDEIRGPLNSDRNRSHVEIFQIHKREWQSEPLPPRRHKSLSIDQRVFKVFQTLRMSENSHSICYPILDSQ
jgi:hypothetical protein